MIAAIHILTLVALVAGTITLVRLWSVLGAARVTLQRLESTRQDVASTLRRVEQTLDSAENLMETEVAPTLRTARATLGHLEIAAQAIAGATRSMRRMAGHAETAHDASKLLAAGGALARMVTGSRRLQQPASGGLLGGIRKVVAGILRPRAAQTSRTPAIEPAPGQARPALEAAPDAADDVPGL